MITEQERTFYAQPATATQLEKYADLIDSLPDDPLLLAKVVRGLLIHDTEIDPNVPGSGERLKDRDIMTAEEILERILRLDSRPLNIERPIEKRMVGYCYTFTVLHTALLRAKGAPARARCGFVNYFDEGKWIDHWVTEYASGNAWVLADAHTGRNNVTRDEFHDAGTAWSGCRSGQIEPSDYGIEQFHLWGWDELRGSLVNDLGALNKAEYGHWEWCDALNIEDKTQPSDELDKSLDLIAEATAGEAQFNKARQLFADRTDLHPPVRT